MITAVLVNTIALALDGYRISAYDANVLQSINIFFTYFFTGELTLKLIGLGIREYFREFMNYFDSIVVLISLIELSLISGGTNAVTALRAIRVFRIFRVLRIIKIFRYLKSMSHILKALGQSLSDFLYLFLLLLLFQVIFTLLGMQIFAGKFNFPEGVPYCNFDTFH